MFTECSQKVHRKLTEGSQKVHRKVTESWKKAHRKLTEIECIQNVYRKRNVWPEDRDRAFKLASPVLNRFLVKING